ncbi:sigma-54-dependent Fis family transcriptional regulator [Numidum massiliense]|uniref:sigma-54-dependent Fis family transcriptional regulator n=1 Tax=Numidum massiliense TaxID=1522315 RepID=UPI0006D55102|nr:sigma-54-dependent Fis family transcriptional regulator [Numidum massiliense]
MKHRVRDIMRRTSLTFTAHISVGEALAIMRDERLPGVPYVSRQGHVEGVVTLDYILQELARSGDQTVSVHHCVERRCRYLEPDAEVRQIWDQVYALNLVVTAERQVIGIVEQTAILRAYATEAEYRLKELDAVFEFAHNGIVAIDEYGTITSFNPAAEKISKVPRGEALGNYLNDVLVPTGLMDVLRSGKPRLGEKYRVGKRSYFTNRTPIVQDGAIKGAVAVFQDISEIEEVTNELHHVKAMKDELETILQASHDGMLVVNSNGVIERTNRAFAKMMGRYGAELQGTVLSELLLDQGFTVSFTDLVALEATVTTVEKNNDTGQVLGITLTPIESDAGREQARFVVNIRDMGELNALREELQKTKTLTEQYKEQLRTQLDRQLGLVAESQEMQRVLELASRVANVDSTVLILGESGVGKEEVATYIHENSWRSDGPFVKINCGAIPEQLIESELFGYAAGAFTGARRNGKAGLLEIAHKGTVLLDEIADLPFHLQVKLLRFLQDSIVTRVGSVQGKKVDVRIVAATNKDLLRKVDKGAFREDLFFRLNVVPVVIPPLRERRADLLPLIHKFRQQFCEKYALQKTFSPEALKQLLAYHWPGNVREMMNVVERCVVTTKGETIEVDDLPDVLFTKPRVDEQIRVKGLLPLKQARYLVEIQLINEALRLYGTTYKAAEVLEVDQSTIVRKLKQHQKFAQEHRSVQGVANNRPLH